MDLDNFISETIKIILAIHTQVDEFTLNSDLKQYILNEAEAISKTQQIDLNIAVSSVIDSLGTPEEFAHSILTEIKGEKRFILIKILIACFLAFFPIILLLIVFFTH